MPAPGRPGDHMLYTGTGCFQRIAFFKIRTETCTEQNAAANGEVQGALQNYGP